jgi:O-antigen/teichoic acid export membrane protein
MMLSTHWLLSTGLALASLLVFLAASPILLRVYQPITVQVLLALLFIWLFGSHAAGSTPEALLKKELRYARLSLLAIVSTVVSSIIAILCAWAGLGIWTLVIREGSRVLMRLVGTWALTRWRLTFQFDWQMAKAFIDNGSHLWLHTAAMLVMLKYDDFLVGNLVGEESLGLYERAYHYAELPMSFLSAVYAVILPTFAKVAHDRAALSKAYALFLNSIALICFPAATLVALLAPELIQVLLGTKWTPAAPLLQILLPFALVRPIVSGSTSLPIVTKQPHILGRLARWEILSMLLICTPMTYLWGAPGAGLSAGFVQLIGLVLLYRVFLSKNLDIDYGGIFTWPLVALGLGAGLALGIQQALPTLGLLPELIVKTIAFSIVYLGVLMLFQRHQLLEQSRYLGKRLFKR